MHLEQDAQQSRQEIYPDSPNMHTDTSGEYLKSAVMTATPEKLQLMLYDGAIRFGRQAREALVTRNFELSCEKLLRTQQIITALEGGLRPEVNEELCRQMANLYQFIYTRLVDANTTHDVAALDDALQILEHQRETWRLLMDKIHESVESPRVTVPSTTTTAAPAGAGFCFQA